MANDVKLTKKHPNYKNQDSNDHITASGNVKNTVTGLAGHDTYDGGKGQDTLVIKADWADAKITETADGFKIKVGSDWIKVTNVEKFKFNDGTLNKEQLINDAPTGTPTAIATHGTEDTAFTVSASDLLAGLTDKDKDTLSISGAVSADNGAIVTDNGDGTYTVTPAANFNGTVTLSYTVSDGRGGSLHTSNTVTVDAVNDAPAVAAPIADQTASEGVAFTATIPTGTFTDVDGDTLTLSATQADGSALPAWLTFDAKTGTFSGTPTDGTAGTVSVKVTASDGTLTASDTFDIVVGDTIKALTTKDDTLVLTSATETLNGDSTTFNAGDIILDSTVGDNDTLNLTLTSAGPAARVENIENVNVNWNAFGTASYDASKTTGATITFSSTKLGYLGDVSVTGTGANTVVAGAGAVGKLTASDVTAATINGTNATQIVVNGTTATTDTVTVLAGASTTSVTVQAGVGATGVETVNVTAGAATTSVTVKDYDTATIDAGKAAAITLDDDLATDKATVTVGADATINNSASIGALTLNIADGKTVTLDNIGASLAVSSAGSVTLTTGDLATANTVTESVAGTFTIVSTSTASDFTKADADLFVLATATQTGAAINTGDSVRVDANLSGGTFTLGTDGTADVANVTFTASQTTLTTFTGFETVNIVAAAAAVTGTDLTFNGLTATPTALHTATINLSGTNDVVTGTVTATVLDASALVGDLTVSGVVGADVTISGASGINTVNLDAATTTASFVGQGAADVVDFGTLAAGITATAVTGAGADKITVDATALVAGTGALSIDAGAGDDTINFTAGGNNGTVVIQGGDGTDTLAVGASDLSSLALTVTGIEKIDTDTGVTFAAAQLSGKTFTITGDGAASVVNVVGTATANTIDLSHITTTDSASTGAVLTVDGLGGGDTISGGIGNDDIFGYAKDSLTGNGGNDTFDFANLVTDATSATTVQSSGFATITDFTHDADIIGLDVTGAAGVTTGVGTNLVIATTASADLAAAFTAASGLISASVEAVVEFVGSDAYVFYDASGNGSLGTNDAVVKLTGVGLASGLDGGDFLI